MSRPPFRLLPVVLCLLAVGVAVNAAGARFWEVGTLSDFLKGDATSLSIDLHGRLLLGPSLTPLADTDAPVLWGAVVATDGTVYVGSGNDGKVLKVTPDGNRSVFYDSGELEVHAVAFAPAGGLYVGTSPDGRVYKVDASGHAVPFFDPDDKYIWGLMSQPDGTLFVATGDKGLIYKVAPDGKSTVFYRTRATHVRSLLFTPDGDLIAGTESPGRVFRINASGTGFLLLDSNLQEVSSLRLGPGGIVYASALSGKPGEDRAPVMPPLPEPSRPPVPTVTAEITGVTVVDVGTPTSLGGSRDSGRSVGKGAVYRIQPDGVWDVVWTSGDDTPYDVALDRDGAVLVATGSKGKIYRVAGEPSETTLLVRAPAQQVTSMVQDAGGLLISTANPGKVFRLSAIPATSGAYESDVRDAESVATWGTISWRGTVPKGGDVKLFTRSGNSAAPDDTWSAWSTAYRRGEGEQIVSPKARYLQWKLELNGSNGVSPVITSVTVAYQQRNQRPEVTSITVHPPGVVFQRPFSSGEAEIAGYDGSPVTQRATAPQLGPGAPLLGRRSYQKGLQTFVWKAQDANDDDLSYDIQYRREGDTTWKALKRNLTDPLFVWDTTSVPNGTYVIKILASDAPANPPGAALVADRESDTFDVDNSPPSIGVSSVTRDSGHTTVRFTVKDADSPVQRVEYSIEADRWRPIYPKDGIADSRTEEFELVLDQDVGDRQIILRAFDTMNNVATTRAEAPAPPPARR
jgi:hypothetical protein